jgi:hypothetical protein
MNQSFELCSVLLGITACTFIFASLLAYSVIILIHCETKIYTPGLADEDAKST